YVNTAAGMEKPQDLAGKKIGELALYGHDAGVWPKGILADEYGLTPDQCSWVIGGTNHPLPALDWIPQPMPAGVRIRHAGPGQTLSAMLESGEIDALISVDVPQPLLNGSPSIARLFPDYEAVERDYYRRTGIFPPMHVVAVRRDLIGHTELLRAVYRAFGEAKELAERKYRDDAVKQHMTLVTPWFSKLFEDNRRLLGEDWWPYGMRANLKAVDTFLRYHYEQGLSKRLLTSNEIFVAEFLDT
ncbi:MAG: 4,5-dihydroxyphthalate decarboxylase, partial [Catenulisporales bacterium]|nr:4,5-dihydroxyphthalate decarboxylase [Catenulisporales bacterium]